MEYRNWKKLIFHFYCNFNRMGLGSAEEKSETLLVLLTGVTTPFVSIEVDFPYKYCLWQQEKECLSSETPVGSTEGKM